MNSALSFGKKVFMIAILALGITLLFSQGFSAEELTREDYEFASPTDPTGLILTWQNDPSETMSMTWRTEEEPRALEKNESYIYYTSEEAPSSDDFKFQEARTWTFEETDYWVHGGELRNLEPDTEYTFYVASGDETSDEYKFRTAPAESREINFIAGADSQKNVPERRYITERAAELNPEFILLTGDLQETPPTLDSNWIRWFKDWEDKAVTEDGRMIPVIPAIGNHEVVGGYDGTWEDGQYYYNSFLLPGNEKFFTLEYGPDLTIVTLDSNHTTPVLGAQVEWLEKILPDLQEDWVVAQYHIPAWGRGLFDDTSQPIRDHWVPLFEEYNVELVHEGHDHTYKVTHEIGGISKFRDELDQWIEDGMESAVEDFDPEEDYTAWSFPELSSLSGGNYEDVEGVDSLVEGMEELPYLISLNLIQEEGDIEEERGGLDYWMIYEEMAESALYENFWREEFKHRYNPLDQEDSVKHIGDGAWGAGLATPKDAEENWYLEETKRKHHFFELTLKPEDDKLEITPYFAPEEDRGDEMEKQSTFYLER